MLNVVFDREVFCHLTSFQSMLMISLKNFDSLVMVYFVGTVFVGCIFYADDNALLCGNCYGLQKW